MPNAQQTLAGGLHGKTGSFYLTDLDDESRLKVHALSSASASTALVASHLSVCDTGMGGTVARVFGKILRWSPEYTAVHGQNISKRTAVNSSTALLQPVAGAQAGKYAGAVLAQMEGMYADGFVRYGIMIPEGLRPETILGVRMLFAGTDFTAFPGFIVMTADPAIEFPSGKFEVAGTQITPSPVTYSSGGSGTAQRQMFCLRSAQSAWAIEKGASEAAGLIVTRGTDVVTDVIVGGSTIYFMASGTFYDVPYDHAPLTLGSRVDDGTVISPAPAPTVSLATSPADFASLAWDISSVNTARTDLLPTDPDYLPMVSDIFNRYSGRLILVRLGALLDPVKSPVERLQKFKAFVRRTAPLGTVTIFQK